MTRGHFEYRGSARRIAFCGAVIVAFASPTVANWDAAFAQDQVSRVAVRHVDRDPQSRAAAQRLLMRLSNAALEACGAPSSSLAEFRRATMKSQCWRDSLTAAVAHIDSPRLTAALRSARP